MFSFCKLKYKLDKKISILNLSLLNLNNEKSLIKISSNKWKIKKKKTINSISLWNLLYWFQITLKYIPMFICILTVHDNTQKNWGKKKKERERQRVQHSKKDLKKKDKDWDAGLGVITVGKVEKSITLVASFSFVILRISFI